MDTKNWHTTHTNILHKQRHQQQNYVNGKHSHGLKIVWTNKNIRGRRWLFCLNMSYHFLFSSIIYFNSSVLSIFFHCCSSSPDSLRFRLAVRFNNSDINNMNMPSYHKNIIIYFIFGHAFVFEWVSKWVSVSL